MAYTILSAAYANSDNTAAVVMTKESAAVLLSVFDTPKEWAAMLKWGTPSGFVPPPDPVPEWISDRQFAQGLAMSGLITEAEAEEWVGPGVVPGALMAFVDALPEEQQFAARMLLRGATQFERDHPLTEAFGVMQGWSAAQVDQFWQDCDKL